METRARYIVIGAFALAGLFAGFGFVYWLKNSGSLGRTIYQIQFDQPISGLAAGATVLFNGVRVGVVLDLKLDLANPKRTTVSIAVDPATPIRVDTKVDIGFRGLTGEPAVVLKGGAATAPALTSQNGQAPILVAGAGVGQNLTESAQQTLHRIDDILDENRKPLHTAITGISTFADTLGRNSKRLEGLIGGLERLAGVGGSKEAPIVYDLAAPTTFPPFNKVIEEQMVVADPNVILAYDTQKILIRSVDGIFTDIDDARWADNLPKLVQAKIVQSFENAHQLKTVSRPIDQLEAANRLELGIRNFQISLEPQPTAVVEFTARLLDGKGKVANAQMFKVSVPAKSTKGPDAVAALRQAFSQAATQLVVWTIGLL
jgi:phospholipid/cholesterol/gamma-HCH transport system substrate-binding protein